MKTRALVAGEAVKRLSALRLLSPEQWRAIVGDALAAAEGHVRDYSGRRGASTILGVSRDTLFRWLREDKQLAKLPTARVGTPGLPPTEERAQSGLQKPSAKKATSRKRKD